MLKKMGKLFCENTANNFVSVKSVINVGDEVVISAPMLDALRDLRVLVLDMSIVLNNTRIFPTELEILFKFRDINTNCEYRLTAENFKYVKHISRMAFGINN